MLIMVDIRCLKCHTSTNATHEQISPLLLGVSLMRNNRARAFECAKIASISITLAPIRHHRQRRAEKTVVSL